MALILLLDLDSAPGTGRGSADETGTAIPARELRSGAYRVRAAARGNDGPRLFLCCHQNGCLPLAHNWHLLLKPRSVCTSPFLAPHRRASNNEGATSMKRISVSLFAVPVLWGVSLAQQPTSPPSNNSTPQEQQAPATTTPQTQTAAEPSTSGTPNSPSGPLVLSSPGALQTPIRRSHP